MALQRYKEYQTPAADINRFDPFSLLGRLWEEGNGGAAKWSPAIDVRETSDAYVVKVEAPGMERDQINVEIKEGVLTISGERKREETENERWHVIERRYGPFTRALKFKGIDEEKVSATYTNGVLEVRVPKTEAARSRRIDVNFD